MSQPESLPTVDAHQHFWDIEHFHYPWMPSSPSPLARNYLPHDLLPQRERAGIDYSIFVQCRHSLEENDWILALADQHPWIAGVVGWVDLASPEVDEQLARARSHPRFVGVRHLVHDEPNDNWLLDERVIAGLKSLARHELPFDLLLRPRHLPLIPKLVARAPELRMVVDHLAKPEIATGSLDPWRRELRAAAAFPNVYCKLSGMITEADHDRWQTADLLPYADVALDCFGPERLMFGSDWPVCRLAGEYAEVVAAAHRLTNALSAAERAAVFGGTACEFYRLPLA